MAAELISILDPGQADAASSQAAALLDQGGVVALPTETVYGVAARLDRPQAVRRLRELRGGDDGRPFTVHLASAAQAGQYLGEVGELGERVMRKLWPGPVALMFAVSEGRRRSVTEQLGVAEADLYDQGWITLRCPEPVVTRQILARVSGPVGATAALSGAAANRGGAALAEELAGKVDLILDAGASKYLKPSTIVKVGNDRYELVRAGVYDERIIERLMKTTILFVCSGNTCRSPMAEAIAKRVISEKLRISVDELEKRGLNVVSAGASAMAGSRATPQAVSAVRELGGDLSRHRSRPLTVELIHQADRIYTMSRSHAQAVTALVPSAAEKVAPLDPGQDVEDPIGADEAHYRELAAHLRGLIDARLKDQALP